MCAVQLQHFQAHGLRTFCGFHECFFNIDQTGSINFMRRVFAGPPVDGRGRHRSPTAIGFANQHAAVPRLRAGSFAPGVGDLQTHRSRRREFASARQGVGQCIRGGVVPQSQAIGCDTALRCDGSGFNHKYAGTAVEQIGPMHQMPVVGLAVQMTGVLAHGSDNYAVGQRQRAARRVQCDGGEEQAHGVSR